MKKEIMKKLNVAVISDLHCGHILGLTHPSCCKLSRHDRDIRKIQEAVWEWYIKEIRSMGQIDYMVLNGDAIDGKQKKNGGNELMTTSLIEQVDMAQRAVECSQAKKYLVVGGTGYHVKENGENFEEVLARMLGPDATFTLGGQFQFKSDGITYPTVFNFRHHMGGRLWNTRTGQLKRYLVNDMIEVTKGDREKLTDILVRSHIHCFDYVKGIRHNTLAVANPCLQARGTEYGITRCDGEYDIGFTQYSIKEDGQWSMTPHIATIPSLRDKVQILS